jgi:hypothetical protein
MLELHVVIPHPVVITSPALSQTPKKSLPLEMEEVETLEMSGQ